MNSTYILNTAAEIFSLPAGLSVHPALSLLAAFAAGLFCALICRRFLRTDRSMTCTIGLLSPVVCAALLAVNGSLGTGMAVMGIFGLVRFRSLPGRGTDILGVFYAMACGLMFSGENLALAALMTVLLGLFVGLGTALMDSQSGADYLVRITLPEDSLDTAEIEQILSQYGKATLHQTKTVHMGTLFELQYFLKAKKKTNVLDLVDQLRETNSNLPVSCLQTEGLNTAL